MNQNKPSTAANADFNFESKNSTKQPSIVPDPISSKM